MASISAPESLPKFSRLWMGRVWLVLCCFLRPILSAQTVPLVNPLDALSKAEIIATVELLNVGLIISVSFEHGGWRILSW